MRSSLDEENPGIKEWRKQDIRDFEFADSIRSTHTAENHDGKHYCDSGNRHAASGKQAKEMRSHAFIIFCNVVVSVICVHSFEF